MKNDRRVLDCRGLWHRRASVSDFLTRFVRRRSGRNDGGLERFSGSHCQVLCGREPLIEFGFAGNAATKDFPLQPREFELLVRNRVSALERRTGERNPVVLPAQIFDREQAVGGELIERPLAAPLELENTSTKFAAASDGRNFREIELCIVGAVEMRTGKICDLSAGREM